MITFKCECGQELQLGDRYAGKLGRCPYCSVSIRVPGAVALPVLRRPNRRAKGPEALALAVMLRRRQGQPALPQSAEAVEALIATAEEADDIVLDWPTPGPPADAQGVAFLEKNLGLVLGSVMLATFFLPWDVVDGKVTMSLDLLRDGAAGLRVLLVGLWLAGLVALLVSRVVNSEAKLSVHAGLGLVGLLLLLAQVHPLLRALAGGSSPYLDSAAWLLVVQAVLTPALVVATAIRLRVGPMLILRIIQGLAAAALGMLGIWQFFQWTAMYQGLPNALQTDRMLDLIVGVLLGLALEAACVMALLHAVATWYIRPGLSRICLQFIYCVLTVAAAYVFIRPLAAGRFGWSLMIVNSLMLSAPVFILLCSGLTECLIRAINRLSLFHPRDRLVREMGDLSPDERLVRLAELLDRNLISEEEFTASKRRMLEGGP